MKVTLKDIKGFPGSKFKLDGNPFMTLQLCAGMAQGCLTSFGGYHSSAIVCLLSGRTAFMADETEIDNGSLETPAYLPSRQKGPRKEEIPGASQEIQRTAIIPF
jgi:hypothetical protein